MSNEADQAWQWFDVRKEECMEEVKAMQWKRIDFAARKGCDAVVPDNLSPSDVTYALWISDTAHSFGLAFGLKNSIELLHSRALHFQVPVATRTYTRERWRPDRLCDQRIIHRV